MVGRATSSAFVQANWESEVESVTSAFFLLPPSSELLYIESRNMELIEVCKAVLLGLHGTLGDMTKD